MSPAASALSDVTRTLVEMSQGLRRTADEDRVAPSEGTDTPMTEERTVQITDIKNSVERAAYVVDARKVAEAMLRRAAEQRAWRVRRSPLRVPRAT